MHCVLLRTCFYCDYYLQVVLSGETCTQIGCRTDESRVTVHWHGVLSLDKGAKQVTINTVGTSDF